MKDKVFVDTNIILYAHDTKEEKKRKIASNLLESLWNSTEKPNISIQVLQELFVNLNRFLPPKEVDELIQIYKNWNVIEISLPIFEKGIFLSRKHKFSLWDSLILSAALHSNANIIYTEDLSHEQKVEGIKIINPFL
jgi:predicted nucleic acid-binding protein